jgi:hypothetical protein
MAVYSRAEIAEKVKIRKARARGVCWQHFIYALVCEISADEFLVKLGCSQDPAERYAQLLTGIGLPSLMMFAHVRSQRRMYKLEAAYHREFEAHNSRREWFRFHVSEKPKFHEATKRLYQEVQGEPLVWSFIKETDVSPLRMRKRLWKALAA